MINVQCEACGNTIGVTIDAGSLQSVLLSSIMPPGWGVTGIPNVTPTALLCGNCRTFVGGYTVASFIKVNATWQASGSAAAIALVSGTNLVSGYNV
jgi:hypothetical protein